MILRNSITKAKKLFNKTLQTFKSMLSDGYQRLPKPPPFNPFSCGNDSKLHHSFRELDSFYDDRWREDPDKKMEKKRAMKKIEEPRKENREDPYNGSFMKFARTHSIEEGGHHHTRKEAVDDKMEKEQGGESSSINGRVEECWSVTQRLKELELMDMSNVDHLLDIEEVLHYYSRISCPFYVDIVNKYFMEMYAEFLPHTSSGTGISRRIPN